MGERAKKRDGCRKAEREGARDCSQVQSDPTNRRTEQRRTKEPGNLCCSMAADGQPRRPLQPHAHHTSTHSFWHRKIRV